MDLNCREVGEYLKALIVSYECNRELLVCIDFYGCWRVVRVYKPTVVYNPQECLTVLAFTGGSWVDDRGRCLDLMDEVELKGQLKDMYEH